MANNWYQVINDETLEQGDILENIDVAVPTMEFLLGETDELKTESYDVIILTQSCDLSNKKTPWVQVTPVVPLSVMQSKFPAFKDNNNLEQIRRGYQHKYHMINECDFDEYRRELMILDFRNVFTLPYKYVSDFVKKGEHRRRLNSPYKEHLSQAYAKFYMRVGLPNDIPKFA